MPSMQNITLIGHLGKDAELRYTAAGNALVNFTVAVSENRKVGDAWKEETEWFRVAWFGDSAERQAQYLSKGGLVYVTGKLKTRSWDKDDGTKGYSTEIMADRVLSLEKRQRREETVDVDDLEFE